MQSVDSNYIPLPIEDHIPLWTEKFAELIIKECGAVQHKRFCEHGDVSWDILMQHFGVEE